jgi:hypothetical protein
MVTDRMGPFEDRIRDLTGVDTLLPSEERLHGEAAATFDTADYLTRLNANVEALIRAVVGLQNASVEIAAEIDKLGAVGIEKHKPPTE